MSADSWIIVTDERRIGGMLDAARQLGGRVSAAVVGPRSLADIAANTGFDQIFWYAPAEGIPAEAYAAQVAKAAKAAAPGIVISSDAPAGRVVLGVVAMMLDAAIIASVRGFNTMGNGIQVSRSAVDGKVIENLNVIGPLACIFDGEDVVQTGTQPIAVNAISVMDPVNALRVVETQVVGADSAGLQTATRVVGIGLGLRSKDDLNLINQLAAAVHAEIACSLPVCDDMRWFESQRVVGSSHNQIAPDLYIAVGISGQPQHMAGVRDAKVVVAINNDPDARIFKNCNIGILGDLYQIVPALTAAFKAAD